MAAEKPEQSTWEKALLVTFFVIMAVYAVTNVVIGAVNADRCYNAALLPPFLVINGVFWVLPPLVLLLVNCLKTEDDIASLFSFLEKVFFLAFVVMFLGTVYVLVSVVHVRTLDRLCVQSWVPPYTFVAIILNWVLFGVFFRVFCVHQLPLEQPPPMEFRHLRGLPPLVFPWNRHRSMRLY